MRLQTYEGASRARVLISVVTNKSVCSRVANQWTPEGLFDTPWANLVAGWCVNHLKKYGEPPGGKIQVIFENWASEKGTSEDDVGRIESFLVQLSELSKKNGESYSDEYLLDEAGKFFNNVRLEKEVSAAQLEIEHGRHQDAQERLSRFKKVEMGVGAYVEPAASLQVWEDAFNPQRQRPLVTYNGVAGQFFSEAFLRGEFYSFLAPEKTGKTTYLIDFTYRAVRARNKVAYFECGDGDQDEVLCRLGCRTTSRPEWNGAYRLPKDWDKEGDLVTEERYLEGIDSVDAFSAFRRFCRTEQAFKLICYPNSTVNTFDIEDQLNDWEMAGWRPDVVVIDYADILAPPKGVRERIEQIDTTWRHLRRISQNRHCLVVTATQANSSAYKTTQLLGPEHFSGSKTKNAHVNGIIAINVSYDERAEGRGRLSWAVRRKNKRRMPRRAVSVAGCFEIENPVILSRW